MDLRLERVVNGKTWLSACIALAVAVAAPASAEDGKKAASWGPPSIAYSADVTFTYGPNQRIKTSFYYSPTRQRMDYAFRQRHRIMIVYSDARLVFELLPDKKLFRKRRVDHLPAWNFGASRPDAERKHLGKETIGEIETDKYAVKAMTPYGEKFEGVMWVDRDRVVIKLDGKQIRGKISRNVVVTVSNLRKGALAAEVFKVPAGFREAPYRKR